jgi:hypothetical protein
MLRNPFLLILPFIIGCSGQTKPDANTAQPVERDYVKFFTRDSFNIPINFLFLKSTALGICQQDMYDTLTNGFPFRNEEIKFRIKHIYEQSNQKLEDSLLNHIHPLQVNIADEKHCIKGTFDIFYKCGWDKKNEVKLVIQQWEVKTVTFVDIVSF